MSGRRALPGPSRIAVPLGAPHAAGIVIPVVTGLRDCAECGFQCPPALFLSDRGLDCLPDRPAAAARTCHLINATDQLVVQLYVHSHVLSATPPVLIEADSVRRHLPRYDRRVKTEQRAITVSDYTFDVEIGGPERAVGSGCLHGFPGPVVRYSEVVQRLHESGCGPSFPSSVVTVPARGPPRSRICRMNHLVSDAIRHPQCPGRAVRDSRRARLGRAGEPGTWRPGTDRFTGLVAVSTGHPSAGRDALSSSDQDSGPPTSKFVVPGAEEAILADNFKVLRDFGVTAEELVPLKAPGA